MLSLRSLTLDFQAFMVLPWHKQPCIIVGFQAMQRSWKRWSVVIYLYPLRRLVTHGSGHLHFVRFLYFAVCQPSFTIVHSIIDTLHIYLLCSVVWRTTVIGEHCLVSCPSTYINDSCSGRQFQSALFIPMPWCVWAFFYCVFIASCNISLIRQLVVSNIQFATWLWFLNQGSGFLRSFV